ncbi:MAG: hypothetical protein ABFD52_13565 [Acidobacteriota bacterium]
MRKNVRLLTLGFAVLVLSLPASAEKVASAWKHDAGTIYDQGFMHRLMKDGSGGVSLFNMDLVETDSAGSGYSEKGIFTDVIWGKNRARKIFVLDDPRARAAYLVVFVTPYGEKGFLGKMSPGYGIGKHPLKLAVNGHGAELENWDVPGNYTGYRWVAFPPEWLKKGANTVELSCPEAGKEDEGWTLCLSRADEFESGGGDPAGVGNASMKSVDGGRTWQVSPFGPQKRTRAEYSVRLSLDRYVRTGWLASPVIDLWKGDAGDTIVPIRAVLKMKLAVSAEVPAGTDVEYYCRKGRDASPLSKEWSAYELFGKGPSAVLELDRAGLNRRYLQFRAVLSTSDPLRSPVIRSAEVTAEMNQSSPRHGNIRVLDADNPPIRYSSIDWEWEKWDRPEFAELRKLEGLDEVVAGTRTELGAQARLLDYVTKRWRNNEPLPEYPGWDAKSIVDHINDAGGGGMCIQLNNALGGFCLAYGYQARLVNLVGHEVCEVWNDDHRKWIYMDASWVDHFLCDSETLEPLSLLEIHRLYTDYFFPDRPIDWMKDLIRRRPVDEGRPPSFRRSSVAATAPGSLAGFQNAAFLFMAPRNNWYEKPFPRPLNSGRSAWPWNGYANWYDEKTPPLRQHAWFTDRPRDLWPDLNTVHVDATTAVGNDRLFLRFETYTPNFSHFEVNVDDAGWTEAGERYTWLLQPGRNVIRVRAASKLGVKGHPSYIALNHANTPLGE